MSNDGESESPLGVGARLDETSSDEAKPDAAPMKTFQVHDYVRIVSDSQAAHHDHDLACYGSHRHVCGRVVYVESTGKLLVNLGTKFAIVEPRDVVHAPEPADQLLTNDACRTDEAAGKSTRRTETRGKCGALQKRAWRNGGELLGHQEDGKNRALGILQNTERCTSVAGVLQHIESQGNVTASRLGTESRLRVGDAVRIEANVTTNASSRRNDSWNSDMNYLVGKVGHVVRIDGDGKVITRVGNRHFQLSSTVLTRVAPNSEPQGSEQALDEVDQHGRHAATIINLLLGFLSEQEMQTAITTANALSESSTDRVSDQNNRDKYHYRKDIDDRENQSPKKRKP